jgi:NAD-dependent DNA ligase
MEKGLKSISPQVPKRSYYVWRYKGTDELLFLGNAQAARTSFLKAAEWASAYTDEESKQVASISDRTAQFLSKNPDSKAARVATWTMVLNNNIDEKTRKRAIREIEALGAKVIVNPDGTTNIRPGAD